ncbi:hypothetical protein [Paenibacillus chibensis]|uniref:hypothetical protein n=1 Tax=Paenibacillus chibensis TaxID=59846 RepID=UPI00157FE14D|nr:hypothetical protein [Paenibacillus chibensis]MEC0368645.1 hypothetical protein [Paenibacillus chibensis]
MKKLAAVMLILFGLMNGAASASWAYPFVVYDGSIYAVTTDTLSRDLIGKPIGKVTRYSDQEGTYRGNFSNQYPKGTVYYEITGIGTERQIAVQADEKTYVRAVYQGPYAGGEEKSHAWWMYAAGAVVLAFAAVFVYYRRRNTHSV